MEYEEWLTVATHEYRRLLDLLGGLSEAQWHASTDCPDWDVRRMVAHLVGAAEATASPRELVRQAWLGRRLRRPGPLVDAMNEVQVAERETCTPAQLLEQLSAAAERGVRGRRRAGPLRRLRLPFGEPLGVRPLGYLLGAVYTRDAWMHRIDICRATGILLLVTAEHDGRLVSDAVEDWAGTHAQPYHVLLSGPAGGQWRRGDAAEPLELDAVEFCRSLAGRSSAEGLLAHQLVF